MKYLFAGGGSGGHIFPAIAIADEIRKLDDKAEILFIGAKGRIEEKIVPSNNYKLETIDISGFDRSNIFKNIKLPKKLIYSLRRCMKLIKEFKPDAAIGTGGFVCGPVIYVSNILRVPTLIQEGNSYAGRTIKFLSKRSKKVVINFKETEKYLKRKDNIVNIPHPIRSSLKITDREKALEHFNLSADRKTIFVFGGSQGARGINYGMEKIVRKLTEARINIIWQTGRNEFKRLSDEFTELKGNVRISEFIDDIDIAYSASDLVICRAGITSIMELAFLQKASILIPLPTSAENHQEMNARSLVIRNAAVLITENEIEAKLFDEIINITGDSKRRNELEENIKQFSDPSAAKKIAEEVIKLIRN
ncbi:MAG TPA: undecaprenyldiphospho-muramoylpentapeptide beta-N-acetylglucosaminyltransferase [Ignavibacteria bacterium]|nr:undecaprenyldiphospho-muramoylpentapeptide beta-N-acetylglucosaminyltransferase [Ignavibacteria bacterium]